MNITSLGQAILINSAPAWVAEHVYWYNLLIFGIKTDLASDVTFPKPNKIALVFTIQQSKKVASKHRETKQSRELHTQYLFNLNSYGIFEKNT
ncbi:MAG: hypothetical protein K9K33_18015 [Desulfarculaceae bacterium]|nr:hypothetical protein [Desulfarculaceae bacterium]